MRRSGWKLCRAGIHLASAAAVLLSGGQAALAAPARAAAELGVPRREAAAASPLAPAIPTGFGAPGLVEDLDPAAESRGSNIYIIGAGSNGLLIRADDSPDGAELWRSDGTSGGTSLVRDLCPGVGSGGTDEAVVFSGTILMNGSDCGVGSELWTTDLTVTGTVLVKDIYTGTYDNDVPPGPRSSNPGLLTVYSNTVFFTASDLGHGKEMWKTDGSLTGTQVLTDINPGPANSGILYLEVFSNTLFFNASDGSAAGSEVWATDGSAAGTGVFADLNPTGGSSPMFFTEAGNQLFFTAIVTGTNDREVWVTDGTPGGTVVVKDIFTGTGSSLPQGLTTLGNKLTFSANDGPHGREVWITDGTLTNTQMISDVNPSGSASPANLTRVGVGPAARVYFNAIFTGTQQALFRTNGITVEQVADPNPAGVFTNTVKVTSYLLEATPGNNTAQAGTTVVSAPAAEYPIYVPLIQR